MKPVEISHVESEVTLVSEELTRSPYRGLRTVRCVAAQGALVLQGTVATYYLKQLAQELALKASSLTNLRNEIRVAP